MLPSIMLISHYGHLVNEEGIAWGPEAARRGAAEQLVPILMTAVVTALGLLPLAWASDAGSLNGGEVDEIFSFCLGRRDFLADFRRSSGADVDWCSGP